MGLWQKLFKRTDAQVLAPTSSLALTAPTTALQTLVLPEGWGQGPVTVAEALKVPAVFRAVTLIPGPISRLEITGAPAWLAESFAQGAITLRTAIDATIKDMMLSPAGDALWFADRDATGQIRRVWYVRRDTWSVNTDGTITINGLRVPAEACLYFSRGLPGLTEAAADTIRQYRALCELISNAGSMPHPRAVLKETIQGLSLSREQADKAQRDFAAMLQSKKGGLAYMPYGLDYQTLDAASIPALAGARNEVRLDVANFAGLDPSMLAGTTGSSNTYSNALQGDREFVELSIKQFAGPFLDRLNQDDVRRGGPRMEFDYSPLEDLSKTQAAGNVGNPRHQEKDNA